MQQSPLLVLAVSRYCIYSFVIGFKKVRDLINLYIRIMEENWIATYVDFFWQVLNVTCRKIWVSLGQHQTFLPPWISKRVSSLFHTSPLCLIAGDGVTRRHSLSRRRAPLHGHPTHNIDSDAQQRRWSCCDNDSPASWYLPLRREAEAWLWLLIFYNQSVVIIIVLFFFPTINFTLF